VRQDSAIVLKLERTSWYIRLFQLVLAGIEIEIGISNYFRFWDHKAHNERAGIWVTNVNFSGWCCFPKEQLTGLFGHTVSSNGLI